MSVNYDQILEARLSKKLSTYPDLAVGDCTPFYFCPRSIMLYMFHMGNHPEISYHGGQEPIIHIVADFYKTIEWANSQKKRWVFTPTNATANYTEDFNNLSMLDKIDWEVVNSNEWREKRDKKQAEFLIEHSFPIHLIEEIGVYSEEYAKQVREIVLRYPVSIDVNVKRNWYY